jgi:hypothetical protein
MSPGVSRVPRIEFNCSDNFARIAALSVSAFFCKIRLLSRQAGSVRILLSRNECACRRRLTGHIGIRFRGCSLSVGLIVPHNVSIGKGTVFDPTPIASMFSHCLVS